MRRIVKSLLALAALAVLSSCDDTSAPDLDVSGNYVLISINGQNLPAVLIANQLVTVRVLSGSVTMNSNNTFSTTATAEQDPVIGQTTTVTETCTGTYILSGATLTFTESGSASTNCGGTYNGTWDGSNTITVALDPSVEAEFRK